MKEDIIEDIIEDILKKYNLYKGQSINYQEFITMYKEHSDKFSETEFANLLGIKNQNYQNFKMKIKKNPQKDIRVRILLNRKLDDKEKILKLLELSKKYNLYKGKKINYDFLMEMYEDVKTVLTEIEFANLLGISESNLKNIRRIQQETKILRNIQLNREIIEKIRKKIIREYEGKRIYYDKEVNKGEVRFLELYHPYRLYFSELEFAELLSISEKNLWYTKNNKGNPIIKDREKIKKIEELSKELEELNYCKKTEIEQLCKKYDLSLDDFIFYYINKGKFFETSSVYRQAIDENDGIYIKQTELKKEEIEEYHELINHIAITVIKSEINKKYKQNYLNDDLKSDIIIYILYNCGDLVKNFKYDPVLMERMIWLRARKYAQIIFINEYKKDMQQITYLDRTGIKMSDIDDIIIDEKINTKEEILIKLFKNYLVQGYSKEEILKNISIFFEIDKTKIIEIMKKYLLENGKVKKRNNGEYELKEK